MHIMMILYFVTVAGVPAYAEVGPFKSFKDCHTAAPIVLEQTTNPEVKSVVCRVKGAKLYSTKGV